MKLGNFDYKVMMHNVNITCSKDVSDLYDSLNKTYRYMINMKDEYIDNLHFVAQQIRQQFTNLGYSDELITDMLIDYLYKNKKRPKQLLWFCYGKNIVQNLNNNIKVDDTKFIQCIDCGEWIEVKNTNNRTCRCKNCQDKYNRIVKTEKQREYRS